MWTYVQRIALSKNILIFSVLTEIDTKTYTKKVAGQIQSEKGMEKKEIRGEKQLEQPKTHELNCSNDMKCFCPSSSPP